ncbi:hypothetical protein LAZ67_15003315 [Cordylochernes scorpioides]|uniref:C2H2-type domain-containing protein n=1 Tax=Cordylochernes scorpioides TaxID=51811 RepID=A0ABY6LB23_9ARAC|nr:hypothetical protein LAZ67_15003315 [Cordylochernes scorpioides]
MLALNSCKPARSRLVNSSWEVGSDEKTRIPAHCDYSTTTESKLKIHQLKHTGEKPFSCPYCEFSTKTKSLLKRHQFIHTGEKPYTCSYCDYKTSKPTNLKQHLDTHIVERPHSCPHCDYRTTSPSYLKRQNKTRQKNLTPALNVTLGQTPITVKLHLDDTSLQRTGVVLVGYGHQGPFQGWVRGPVVEGRSPVLVGAVVGVVVSDTRYLTVAGQGRREKKI